MKPIRVLVADDDPSIRKLLERLIAREQDFELVATATSADETIEAARNYRPDIVLMDVRMPSGGGPRAAREIRRLAPDIRIVAFSGYDDRDSVMQMVEAGASGYVVKGASLVEVSEALRQSMEGRAPLSGGPAAQVVQELSSLLANRKSADSRLRAQRQRVEEAIGGGLVTVYQPIFDLRSGTAVGVEALARFPTAPEVSPEVWFSDAAEVGLLLDLELSAARRALDDIRRLPPEAFMSLNMSPETALSPRFEEIVAAVPLSRIVIEITEHAAVADYDALAEALRKRRAEGARLAIDDTGAGFASLHHILRLEPELIKLDISLIRGIDVDRYRRALASALISFASEIGAAIVAEGIETEDELGTLRELGVDFGQGFYLARPGPLPRGNGGSGTSTLARSTPTSREICS